MGCPARAPRRPAGGRDLRLYLAGQATSVFGSTLTTTATAVVAVSVLHAGPRQISLVVISGTVPMLMLGPWAGVLADRVTRPRRALLATDAVAGLAVLGCGVAGLARILALAWLCGLTFTLSLCAIFVEALYFAHLRGLGVADLGRARGQLQSGEMLARSAAASVAGALAELLGPALLFLGDALTYLASFACLRALRAPDQRAQPLAQRSTFRREFAQGISVVRGHRLLTAYLGYSFLVNLAATGVATLRPVFLLKVLGLPVALYSLPAFGATLLGAAGSMLAPRLLERAGSVRGVLTVTAIAAPVSALILPAAGGPSGLVLAAVTAGTALPLFFGATSNLALITMLTRDIGDEFFGRITGLLTSCATLASTFGAVLGGYVGDSLGVRAGIWLCQGCGLAGALVLLAGARKARATPEGSPVMDEPSSARPGYPPTPRGTDADDYHGRLVADPYRWLEDGNAAATRAWQRAQHELAAAYLEALPGIPEFGATLKRLAVGPGNSPVKIAGRREFRVSRPSTDVGWTVEVRDGPEGSWRPLLARGALGRNAVVRRWQPSPHGRYIALQVTEAGDESVTPLTLVDVATGEAVETCRLIRYSPVEWRGDEQSFCYVRRHLDQPGSGVYLHEVGADLAADRLLLGDDSPTSRYHVNLWHDRWLLIWVRDGTSRESRVLIGDLDAGHTLLPLPCEGTGAGGVLVDSAGRLLATVAGRGEYGRVVRAEPSPHDDGWLPWQTLIPQDDAAVLGGVTLTSTDQGDRLVVLRSRVACSELAIYDAATGSLLTEVTVPGHGTVTGIAATSDPALLSVSYTDWVTPLSEWTLDVTCGVMLPAGEPPAACADVEITRASYRSSDGTMVPLTILAPATRTQRAPEREPRPTILTCYGGFGIAVRPTYQPDALAWAARGGVVAAAGVRGGGEHGMAWHEAGVRTRKANAFADLHAAGEWLIAEGWTATGMLALLGGSNGGLLITGEMVAHPECYAALSSFAAPLDMIRYQLSGLGRSWRREYGSPENAEEFAALLGYSPYHNARPGRYPAVLLSIGTNDTRVDPLHSRKMAAQLQYAVSTGGPVLLQVLEDVGHLGVSGERANELASRMLAFLARHTGLNSGPRQ